MQMSGQHKIRPPLLICLHISWIMCKQYLVRCLIWLSDPFDYFFHSKRTFPETPITG